MKLLWGIVSFLAVVNLLAVLIFTGWLWQSNRLDRGRIDQVREMIAIPIHEVEAAREAAAEEAKAEEATLIEQARLDAPPVASAAQIHQIGRIDEQHRLALEHIKAQKQLVERDLDAREADLARRERELAEERAAWEASVADAQRRREDAQFRSALKIIEKLPPKQGKQKIMDLVNAGKRDQAVLYLDAMGAFARGKVFREFKSDQESQLATELLEEIRMLGVASELDEDSPDADPASPATGP
jgi:hypothetical protein